MVPVLVLLAAALSSHSALATPTDASGGVIASIPVADQSEADPAASPVEEGSVEVTGIGVAIEWTICLAAIVMLAVIVFFRAWRIPPGIGPFWPVRSDVLIGSWIVMLLAGAAGGYITMLSLTESSPLRQQAMTMIVLYVIDFVIIGMLLLIITRARREVALAAEPTRRSTPLATGIAWGVLGFIVAFPIAQSFGIVIGIVQEYVGGWVPEVLAHDTLKAIQAAPGDPWAIVVMVLVVLVTPLVEEFSYRGLIQQGFRGLGADRFSAILLTSLLFVFMHVPALPYTSIAPAIATLLALSFFLGWLHERTGRLAAPIIAHALFNAANLAFFEFGF